MNLRRFGIGGLACSNFLLIISILLAQGCRGIDDNQIVLTINNESVTKAEYLFIMSCLKPEVYSSFAQNFDGPDFWKGNFNGVEPGKILHQKTVQAIKRIKTEQLLMKAYNIADDITYNSFITSLNAENSRRKMAIEKKIPIYGPVEFNERTYFQYLHSERVQKLKRSIISESSIRQDDINRRYEDFIKTHIEDMEPVNPDELKAYIKMELLNKKYQEMIDAMEKKSILVYKINSRTFEKIQNILF
jgi:hypothetical protein